MENKKIMEFLQNEKKTGNIRIEIDGFGRGRFYIDDQEIQNVLGYSISHHAMEKPIVHIDVYAPSLTFNAPFSLPKLPPPWDEYYEPKEEFRNKIPPSEEA